MGDSLKTTERARFLNPLIKASFSEANDQNQSLTLLRPQSLSISWKEKTDSELASERQKHAELANQMSLFDSTAEPLVPCPIQFTARWKDQDGSSHSHECDDWETSAAYNRFERKYDQHRAIEILREKYEQTYFQSGLVLAFSTHSRRNVTFGTQNQWLLVGIIRLDFDTQGDLLLS